MVLFCTWFAWVLHAKRNLHWRHRGHRTRGWQAAAAVGDFRLRSVPPVKLAISSLCWNRSFDWRFQTGYEPRVAGLCRTCRTGFFDFLGLGESCHLVWRFAHKEIAHSNGDLHLLSVYKICSVFIKLTTIASSFSAFFTSFQNLPPFKLSIFKVWKSQPSTVSKHFVESPSTISLI